MTPLDGSAALGRQPWIKRCLRASQEGCLVRGTIDSFDFKRDSFSKTAILFKPPPIVLTQTLSIVLDPPLVLRLEHLDHDVIDGQPGCP